MYMLQSGVTVFISIMYSHATLSAEYVLSTGFFSSNHKIAFVQIGKRFFDLQGTTDSDVADEPPPTVPLNIPILHGGTVIPSVCGIFMPADGSRVLNSDTSSSLASTSSREYFFSSASSMSSSQQPSVLLWFAYDRGLSHSSQKLTSGAAHLHLMGCLNFFKKNRNYA